MSDMQNKLHRIATASSNVHMLTFSLQKTLSEIPFLIERFVQDPVDENVSSLDDAFSKCQEKLQGIQRVVIEIATEIVGENVECNEETGDVEVQAIEDDDGIRLK